MIRHYLDILADTIRENWHRPALTDFYLTEDGTAQDTTRGNHYTYGEMYGGMMRLGEWFRALGIKQGDHIAICGSNSAHWAVAYLAIAAYQGVAVTVLHSQNIEDIARQIDFSDSIALFTDKELWEELSSHNLPQIKYVIALDDFSLMAGTQPLPHYTDTIGILKGYNKDSITISHGELDNLAMICFTSGSSGMAKGVMLSYANVSNNVYQAFLLYPRECNTAFLSFLPFTHMAGLIGDMLSQLSFGKNIHILQEAITINNIMNGIKKISPYMFVSVPAIFTLDSNPRTEVLLEALSNSCKLIFIGGSKIGNNVEQKIIDSKIPLSLIYGQTETGASISISPYGEHRIKSVGKIVSGMTARISPEGEILVRGENVMLGYYKDPEATAAKIDKDGWLHTGDAGYMDEDGYLYVTGRIGQDMIVLPNGENIHPEDIESKINAIQEVKESIVLAREGKLVAIVVVSEQQQEVRSQLRRKVLQEINPQLPLYSQLYDVEMTDQPLARTAKQTIKRYLYK